MTGGSEGFFWVWHFGQKAFFLRLWKTPGFFWVVKTTQGFFGVLHFSPAQIKNNISAIHSFVFDQNQSWSWHVLAFQKINNKICWCKNTEGFFGGMLKKGGILLGRQILKLGIFWVWNINLCRTPSSLKYVSGAPGLPLLWAITWMRWSRKPALAAEVAAPIWKLWLEKSPHRPADRTIALNLSVSKEPDKGRPFSKRNRGPGRLLQHSRKETTAWTAHKGGEPGPIKMLHPFWNGSVLEAYKGGNGEFCWPQKTKISQ